MLSLRELTYTSKVLTIALATCTSWLVFKVAKPFLLCTLMQKAYTLVSFSARRKSGFESLRLHLHGGVKFCPLNLYRADLSPNLGREQRYLGWHALQSYELTNLWILNPEVAGSSPASSATCCCSSVDRALVLTPLQLARVGLDIDLACPVLRSEELTYGNFSP